MRNWLYRNWWPINLIGHILLLIVCILGAYGVFNG